MSKNDDNANEKDKREKQETKENVQRTIGGGEDIGDEEIRLWTSTRRKERKEEIERTEGEIDKEKEKRVGAMTVGRAVGAPYYREIKGSNSSRDFY